MGRLVLLILVGTLLSVLFVTNPNEASFQTFLGDEARQIVGDAGEDAGGALGFITERLGRVAGEAAGQEVGERLASRFERSNYLLFSLYDFDTNGRREGGEWQFLGLASQFFPLKTPDDLVGTVRDLLL